MIFKQLFDEQSSTYTYLLGNEKTGNCVIIDPVLECFDRDLALLHQYQWSLQWVLETHIHADHITSASRLKKETGAKVGLGVATQVAQADRLFEENDRLEFDGISLEVRMTPGHTSGCVSYCSHDRIFTGDALLIQGCGRTDFQEGNAHTLFHSVREKIFSLPDETLVFPAHDYQGRTSSTIGDQKRNNPRLKLENSESEFVEIMKKLKLPLPKKIQIAVPANLNLGEESK
ncbi:MAG: Zn-dependent hydrolase [Bdellovibrionaceae bacterium]|nr:Zn-dependent hydrolase [Pseudobdellovibrionaceae bacterium]